MKSFRSPFISMILFVLATSILCNAADGQPVEPTIADVHAALRDFDNCRALTMRSLAKAQDLKCVYLYGRGWGLDLSEGVAEDAVLEGVALFDHLYAIDVTGSSLLSYAAMEEHPDLSEELAVFRATVPDVAGRVSAYDAKVSKLLKDAIEQVNTAAKAKAPYTVQTIPATPMPPAIKAAAGDGFNFGWVLPVVPQGGYKKTLAAFGYPDEYMLQKAAEAGLNFIRPYDANVFEWPDVEKVAGQYDWSRVDAILAGLKKHNLAIWLRLPSSQTSPPQWLIDQVGPDAILRDINDKPIEVPARIEDAYMYNLVDARPKKNPINLFNPQVRDPFVKFMQELVKHVRDSGVPIQMIELVGGGDRGPGLPMYGGTSAEKRFYEWLMAHKIDPPTRWRFEVDPASGALLIPNETDGTTDIGDKRMLLDIARWREDEYIEYFRPQVEAIRAVSADIPICTESAPHGEFNESMDGRDHERLNRELGLVPFSFSSENIWDDLRRAESPSHFSVANTHSGAGDAYAQYAFSGYVHDSLTLWTLSEVRGFYWGDSIFFPDLRWQWTSHLGWRRFHQRAQGMAPEMLSTHPTPQVAVMWSETSGKQQSFIRDYVGGTYGFRPGPANYQKVDSIGWGRILDSVDLAHDFVTEQGVRDGKLAGYQMLVMPSVQALPADVAKGIATFVENGGIVVATSAPALYNDDLEQQGAGQLAQVFGADFDHFLGRTPLAESPMIIPTNETGGGPWTPNADKAKTDSDTLRTLYATFKPREGAQVLEKFTTGEPAVILNTFGKGKAVVIGYPMGRESFLSDFYHEHYGNNWPDLPLGSKFQQGLFNWFELLWPKIGFTRTSVVAEELAARPHAQDTSWPSHMWPRAGQGYRDYTWQTAKPSRSVETILRAPDDAQNNSNRYLTLFNREGSYGFDPGADHFEATSKELTVQLTQPEMKLLYDTSLGCPVPFQAGSPLSFHTMLEPSQARMFVIASADATVRLYEGNRQQGGTTDDELRQAVGALGETSAPHPPLPDRVVLGEAQIQKFLAERGPKGILISAEDQADLPAAEQLAAAIEKRFGKPARVSRNVPRIGGNHVFLWNDGRHFVRVDQPDIILGNRDTSHTIDQYVLIAGMAGHTLRIPILPSSTFPGPGQCVVELLRPYTMKWGTPGSVEPDAASRWTLEPAPTALIVGASDTAGIRAGVEQVIQTGLPEQ